MELSDESYRKLWFTVDGLTSDIRYLILDLIPLHYLVHLFRIKDNKAKIRDEFWLRKLELEGYSLPTGYQNWVRTVNQDRSLTDFYLNFVQGRILRHVESDDHTLCFLNNMQLFNSCIAHLAEPVRDAWANFQSFSVEMVQKSWEEEQHLDIIRQDLCFQRAVLTLRQNSHSLYIRVPFLINIEEEVHDDSQTCEFAPQFSVLDISRLLLVGTPYYQKDRFSINDEVRQIIINRSYRLQNLLQTGDLLMTINENVLFVVRREDRISLYPLYFISGRMMIDAGGYYLPPEAMDFVMSQYLYSQNNFKLQYSPYDHIKIRGYTRSTKDGICVYQFQDKGLTKYKTKVNGKEILYAQKGRISSRNNPEIILSFDGLQMKPRRFDDVLEHIKNRINVEQMLADLMF